MIACTSMGANGTHCCIIGGEVCEFLFPWTPKCSLYSEWGNLNENPDWVAAPVGQFFAANYPGFDCGDWPQKIPEVMEREPEQGPFYACCWGRGNA